MNAKTLFDFKAYIDTLTNTNRLAKAENFFPCRCSGLYYLEDLLTNLRSKKAFVCVSDTSEDSTHRQGGGWFKRSVFTVFILMRYNTRNQQDYAEKLSVCRELFRQFHSRFIIDEADLANEMAYLAVDEIRSRELGGDFLNGTTGLYFMISMDEPIDLQYDGEEWD